MLQPGQFVGPYTLVRELGRGGFGAVWLGERRGVLATTQVAVKIALDVQPDLDLLSREAAIWVRASGHPNVLPVIEADVYDGTAVIVSEFVAGGSLAGWLRRQPGRVPPYDTSRAIAAGIAAGLAHLHARGIIHRDVKPGNVLLQGACPRLTDFGLAKVLKADGHSATVGGTPPYMAPEAWEGQRGAASDIWGVGVVLYEMLAGVKPFPQRELMPLFRAISKDPPEPLGADVPPELARVVRRCLEKRVRDRFGTAEELHAELTAARRGQPRPSAVERSRSGPAKCARAGLQRGSPPREGPDFHPHILRRHRAAKARAAGRSVDTAPGGLPTRSERRRRAGAAANP
jgi:serine/threonine protein kinase